MSKKNCRFYWRRGKLGRGKKEALFRFDQNKLSINAIFTVAEPKFSRSSQWVLFVVTGNGSQLEKEMPILHFAL